jgi:O-antigen/teichoic acid export membrane protein
LSWLAVVAPELISLIYGENWLAAVLAVQLLSIAGALKSVGTLVGLVFKSRGKPQVELYWNIFWAALLTAGTLVAVRWGINGVAATVSLLSLFGVLYTERLACRYLELPWRRLLGTLAPPFVSAVIATAAVFALGVTLRSWLPGRGLVDVLRLVILTLALAACYAGFVRLLIPGIAAETRSFLAHFRKAA